MNPAEFTALARVEREHWFYRGKRDVVHHWARRLLRLCQEDVVVDVGAGTGQLLIEFSGTYRAIGIEPHPQALQIAGGKPVQLVQGSVTDLPLTSGRAALVTALDVLEHVEDDAGAFAELLRITRPGGFMFIHVPAFQALWSDWDESLGHKRRYTKQSLLRVVSRFDVTVRRCVYVNTAAFVPVLCYRWLRTRVGGGGGRRWEDDVPTALVNQILYKLFVAPACWSWLSPPFGVSILCIIEKPTGDPHGRAADASRA
jgi:SAM-dependent methyltransferase